MYHLKAFAVGVAVLCFNAVAGVGLQSEVGMLNLSDILMSSAGSYWPDDVGTKIGVRIGEGPVSFDALAGIGFNGEEEVIDSLNQYGSPRYFNFGVTAGICATMHEGDKSALSILARYSIVFSQDGDYYMNSSGDEVFDYYTRMIHSLFFGFEPCYKFSDNFELFSNYGLTCKLVPHTKMIEQTGVNDRDWVDRDDGNIYFGFSGILIGFRYTIR